MKRICFIDYDMSVTGGVEQVTASLANTLSKFCEVHVVSLVNKGELAYRFDPAVKHSTLLEQEERLSEMRKKLKTVLSNYLNANGIDVAFLQGNYPGFLGSVARFKTKTKLVFCDHGALMNQWDRKDIVVIRLISSFLCHKVITLTEQSRNDYRKRFLLSAKKVDCIYNWIDSDVPRSDSYDAESKRIVSAGRFGKEKGFDLLVKAFAPVAKKHSDWVLDIFGDGEMMDTVKDLVDEYALNDNVNLLGMRRDLADRYRDYAMYVLPSYREGMPLVLLEAKANRLPIVSFDIMTGPKEIVRDQIDGILVEPYNLEKLGDSICRLIEDREERIRMSERSQENLNKFSKETITDKWLELIQKM